MAEGAAGYIIGAIIAAGSAVYSAQEQKKSAREQRKAQEEEARRQAQLARARATREKRIKQAKTKAMGAGAGIGGTTIDSAVTGAESFAQGTMSNIDQSTATQMEQFQIQEDAVKAQSNAQIGQALGSVVGSFSQVDFGGGSTGTTGGGEIEAGTGNVSN